MCRRPIIAAAFLLLLYVERVSYDEQNSPGEFLRIMYRGDRYVLYNELFG